MKQFELLAPAGDRERFVAAVAYGADAVYLGGKEFGMRAAPQNFDNDDLKWAVDYAHSHGVKVYLTCNTLPRNDEIDRIPEYFKYVNEIGVDALIIADLGVMALAKQYAPDVQLHISTQFGVTNYQSATQLYEMGASRVVLARELSIEEIAGIRANTPPELELECFVHGAMCMSVSGRCLISNYLISRDANRGECAQPCRWGYHLMEEKRPGEYFPIFEDEQGSYILNAKDMCMIEHLDKMAKAGVTSFKIEGRAKANYYVAVVTNAYRAAIDLLEQDVDSFVCPQWCVDEVHKVSHRQYSTGFYFGTPDQYYQNGGYVRDFEVSFEVTGYENGCMVGIMKNKFSVGDEIEILCPKSQPITAVVTAIYDENGESIDSAIHPMMVVKVPCDTVIPAGSMVRKAKVQ